MAMFISTNVHAIPWDDKDAATRRLAECVSAYAHIAQQFQLADNNGAATNYLSRFSTALTANMFLNREGERVPGERIRLMQSAQTQAREARQNDIERVVELANSCDAEMPDVVRRMRNEPPLFGESFLSAKAKLLDQMKGSLGL